MADPVETISFVARRLIQFELRFSKAEMPRRRGASQLFTQISRSVGALGPELTRDHLPHDACRELALYASRLEAAVAEELGEQEAVRLAEALSKACDKENLFLEFRTSDWKISGGGTREGLHPDPGACQRHLHGPARRRTPRHGLRPDPHPPGRPDRLLIGIPRRDDPAPGPVPPGVLVPIPTGNQFVFPFDPC